VLSLATQAPPGARTRGFNGRGMAMPDLRLHRAGGRKAAPVRDLTRPQNTGGLLGFDQMTEAGGGRQGRAPVQGGSPRGQQKASLAGRPGILYARFNGRPRAPGAQK
jgi:hypothetical protein